jgi:4-amino-4-deoxy-L-arabinose transferase-like glycosyltransferase
VPVLKKIGLACTFGHVVQHVEKRYMQAISPPLPPARRRQRRTDAVSDGQDAAASLGTVAPIPSRFTWREVAVLLFLCSVLYGYRLIHHRDLTTHQAVHCENVREMFLGGDWIIPTYGGRPWLERPPLPHWITGAAASAVGGLEQEWALRLGSILAAVAAVVLVARLSAVWYGRTIGLLSGAILATMREFADYGTGPEADIFLCALVTLAHALLIRLEFRQRPVETMAGGGFWGARSWTMLAWFVVLGLTNLTKGPFFGMFFILVPMAGYYLWSADWKGLGRYVWLWGWLAFAVTAGSWYAAALWRYADMTELWTLTYTSRLDTGYLGEPVWYYLVHLSWNSFPWVLVVGIGLAATARRAWWTRGSPERYLWCWALLPPLLLSIPTAKHHHYLLHVLPPLAVLGALGTVRLWRWLGERSAWCAAGPRNATVAAAIAFAVVVVGQCLGYAYQAEFQNSYADDSAFLHEAAERTPAGQPVLVVNDSHPLNASWFLFYLHGRGRLLHNLTFLRADDLPGPEVFLIARTSDRAALGDYGAAELLLQSRRTRGEQSADDRWALFRVRLHSDLQRHPGAVRISPAQAAGLIRGPFLCEKPGQRPGFAQE